MNQSVLTQFFQNSNLVSARTAEEIAVQFSSKFVGKNQFLLQEEKICNEYFILEKGFMRAFAYNTDGDDITTSFYATNQVVFEVSSFFNRTRSQENIQAITDCSGWYITYDQLNNLFHSLPEFREFGRSILVKGFTTLKSRMLSLITDTAEQRYADLVKTRPEIFQQAALKHIATYLGITDTSLSRIRKEYSKK